jgi:hypothetical protein
MNRMLVIVGLVGALGLVGDGVLGTAGRTSGWDAAPVLKAIKSSHNAETFLLANTGPRGIVFDASGPTIDGYRIHSSGPGPDSSAVSLLQRTIRRAARERCGAPDECLFEPRYAIRFHDAKPPLDILISFDCEAWSFQRGMERVPGFLPYARCVRDSLRHLMARVFPDSGGVR